jgi:ABC-type branched-subunit amino acid transport system substrate-binding protein
MISAADWRQEFVRAYEALGGQVLTRTPYNEHQGSYQAEVARPRPSPTRPR